MHLDKLKFLRRHPNGDKATQVSPFTGYIFVSRTFVKRRIGYGACSLVFLRRRSTATTERALQSVKLLMRRVRLLQDIVAKPRKSTRDLSAS